MDIDEIRTWIIFYLISFVVLLWALFLTEQGVLLGIGLMLVIVIMGLNFVVVSNEIKKVALRKERLQQLANIENPDENI